MRELMPKYFRIGARHMRMAKKKSIAILRVRLIFLSRHFHLTTRLVVISDTYQLIEEIKLGILAPRCNYDL